MSGPSVGVHSIKPFLLDSILAWCANNSFTPILVVAAHPQRELPMCLASVAQNSLAFKIGDSAVNDRQITTEHISFLTYFKQSNMPQQVLLPVDCWLSLRLDENPHVFDFSFAEELNVDPHSLENIWPNGIALHKIAPTVNVGERGMGVRAGVRTTSISSRPNKAKLSLVWSDGKSIDTPIQRG